MASRVGFKDFQIGHCYRIGEHVPLVVTSWRTFVPGVAEATVYVSGYHPGEYADWQDYENHGLDPDSVVHVIIFEEGDVSIEEVSPEVKRLSSLYGEVTLR